MRTGTHGAPSSGSGSGPDPRVGPGLRSSRSILRLCRNALRPSRDALRPALASSSRRAIDVTLCIRRRPRNLAHRICGLRTRSSTGCRSRSGLLGLLTATLLRSSRNHRLPRTVAACWALSRAGLVRACLARNSRARGTLRYLFYELIGCPCFRYLPTLATHRRVRPSCPLPAPAIAAVARPTRLILRV